MRIIHAAVAALTLALPHATAAHHSNSIFDLDSVVTLQGSVISYDWRNPHVYVYVDARDDSGRRVEWQLEGDPTPLMARSGWTPTSLKHADEVVVRLNPDRNGQRHHGLIVSLTTPSGAYLTMRSGGRASAVQATSIAGVWDALRGVATRRFIYGELTEKGRLMQAAYDESQNPVIDCVPFPTPTLVTAPYLHEIELADDRVIFRTELFHVERTVHMDGRGHPADGERSNQGHSIGWWEGDVLVVDTTLFADNRYGNRNGIPSGAQKHVIERFRLSDDRAQLLIEYIVEDPEYMVEPMTGGTVWDHAADRELQPFGCDQENARRYAVQ